MRWLLVAVLLAGLAQHALADTVVVDFESLRREDADLHIHGDTYREDGFTFTARHHELGNPHRFNTVGIHHYLHAGSTALFQGVSLGEIILTRDGLLPFDLLSLELAALPNGDADDNPIDGGPFDLTFYGERMNGTTVSQTVHVDNFMTLTAFHLDDFTALRTVRWFQGPAPDHPNGPLHQFDNVVLRVDGVNGEPVPLPATVVAGGTLLAGLAGGRIISRRRRDTSCATSP